MSVNKALLECSHAHSHMAFGRTVAAMVIFQKLKIFTICSFTEERVMLTPEVEETAHAKSYPFSLAGVWGMHERE